jgi:imidazolonepropionase-like amidohydrolase
LLAEIRFIAREYPNLGRERILQLGTINAARALGLEEEIGSLTPGKMANLAVVALPERNNSDPCQLLLESDGPVVQTWFGGRRVHGIAPT